MFITLPTFVFSVLLTHHVPSDFQYRVPREIEPQSLRGVGPLVLSTF